MVTLISVVQSWEYRVERLQVDEVKANFDDVMNLVANTRQRIVIAAGGRDKAALIPVEDVALLERLDGDLNVPVERVAAAEVVSHIEADLDLVADQSQRIIVLVDGREVVALVPPRDLTTLMNLDDRLDIEAAKRLLQRELEEEDD